MRSEDWFKSKLKETDTIDIVLLPTQYPHMPESLYGKWRLDINIAENLYYLCGVFNRNIINAVPVTSVARHKSGDVVFEPKEKSIEDDYVLRAVQDKYGAEIRNFATGFRSAKYGQITKEEYIAASKKGRK